MWPTEVRPSWCGGIRNAARRVSAGDRVQRTGAGLDCRSPARARAAGTGGVCRRVCWPCRAHARDCARLPDHRGAGRTRRRRPYRGAAGRRGPALARVPPASRAAVDLRRNRCLRRRPARPRAAPPLGQQGVSLRSAGPEGRRLRRARGPWHRRVRRAQADRAGAWRAAAGVHGTPLPRRRQVVRARGAAGPGPEIHGRLQGARRPAGRDDLGEGQDARQEGDARHGGRAAQALRGAQGRSRPCLRAGHPLAAGVRGRLSVRVDGRSALGDHRHQERHGDGHADGPPPLR